MRRSLRPIHRLVLWAMLSPFLLLALVPVAVMPARTAEDGFAFVLCSDHGPVELTIDPATGQPVKKHAPGANERCAWAGAHVTALAPPHLPTLPTGLGAAPRRHAGIAPMVLVAADATGRPPATGPPSRI
jgi:hypothetical protein